MRASPSKKRNFTDEILPIIKRKRPTRGIFIIKRSGAHEELDASAIQKRLKQAKEMEPVLSEVDVDSVFLEVIKTVRDGMTTAQIDEDCINYCISLARRHPEYEELAKRLSVITLHRNVSDDWLSNCLLLTDCKHPDTGRAMPQLSSQFVELVMQYGKELQPILDSAKSRDFEYRQLSIAVLSGGCYLKHRLLASPPVVDGSPKVYPTHLLERPQQMHMRCALAIHRHDIKNVIAHYEWQSKRYISMSSAVLFHAGSVIQQLCPCFVFTIQDDLGTESGSIMDMVCVAGKGSGAGCGIGMDFGLLRSRGAIIGRSGRPSNGAVAGARVFGSTLEYANQANNRKGAGVASLPIWHPDSPELVRMRKGTTDESVRCQLLNHALWIPDLFMERAEKGEDWTFFSPDTAIGLTETYGDEWRALYLAYEKRPELIMGKINALEFLQEIAATQIETGEPYILFSDQINKKSNQQNIGIIRSSNLCTEITLHTSKEEIAVCNLASLALSTFVEEKETGEVFFNFKKLEDATSHLVLTLDRVIDITSYVTESSRRSNFNNRPIGIGIQGLAEVFFKFGCPFTSPQARKLNIEIAETIYYAAVKASMNLARTLGPYPKFKGSPASKGLLQFDMWEGGKEKLTGRYPWDELKKDVVTYGLRNSTLIAYMPTASTSQIIGGTESFEPISSNIYIRKTLSGNHIYTNLSLTKHLVKMGLWSEALMDKIKENHGSVQGISEIPKSLQEIYKTVWEISQKTLIDMAADRGLFVDQSQSLSLYFEEATVAKLCGALLHGWKKGLKTGMYYCRVGIKTPTQIMESIVFASDKTEPMEIETVKEKDEDDEKICMRTEDCKNCGA